MSTSKQSRVLPEEFAIAAEQAILNMAIRGCKVLDVDGADVTKSMISQAERINESFDKMLDKKRRGESIQVRPAKKIPAPKPGPMQSKSPKPKEATKPSAKK